VAVSPLFIVRLKRMVARLHDPYPLSEAERIELASMLSFDEQVEIERIRQEQLHFNELMYLQLDPIEPMWRLRDISALRDRMVTARREAHKAKARADNLIREADRIRAMGYRNPHVLRGIRSLEASAVFPQQHYESYLSGIFWEFDKLSPVSRLYVQHRGPRTWENLPRAVESWENVVWPDHPNAYRQAVIEVLTSKLGRLVSDP